MESIAEMAEAAATAGAVLWRDYQHARAAVAAVVNGYRDRELLTCVGILNQGQVTSK